jgi:uncharacterized protein
VTDRRVLIDTGPIVALMSASDEHHGRCTEILGALSPPLLTCWPVLTEAVWLLRKQPVARDKLFAAFDAGLITVLSLDAKALPWTATFMRRYESIRADLPDAAVVYLAEREKIRTIFTLDLRDFSVYRLKGNRSLIIIPELQ